MTMLNIFSALVNKLIPRKELGSDLLPLFLYSKHNAAFSHEDGISSPFQIRLISDVNILQAKLEFKNNSVGIIPATTLFLRAYLTASKTSISVGTSIDISHEFDDVPEQFNKLSHNLHASLCLIMSDALVDGDTVSPRRC